MAWSERARQLLDRHGEVAALIAIGALAFLPMIGALAALPLHVAPTYNEGWNAYQASAAMSGGALYPPPEALASNNYPPLSFYIVGAFGALVGDNILAGRLIALTAMMVVAAGVALLAGKLSGSARAGTIAALLFVGYSAVRTANNYVAINDPQWLAHALMTAGLAVFVFRRETLPGLLTAAALMLAGGLVKHLLIAAPIAVTIWLAVFDRKRLIAWLIGAGGMAVAALAICWALYGRNFFDSLISTPRIVSLEQALGYLDYWFTPLIAMAVATAFLALRAWSRDTALIVLYVLVAFGVGLMSMGGAGVNANATFDLVIALSIASGVAVNFVSQLAGPDHWPVRVMVVAGLSAGFALAAPIDIHRALLRLEQLPAERLAWEREIGRIRAVPGPVACETLSACYWAGKDFEIDFFILGQKLYIGKTSVDEAMAQLDARGVEALLVEKGWKGALLGLRLPEPMHAALAERFDVTPAYIEGHYFLTRKSTQP